jgi:peptidoglycan/xylan/chitin deacetylase (PgdA/CDA1 family)
MLNHRVISTLYVTLILTGGAFHFFAAPLPWWYFAALTAIFIAIVSAGSSRISSGYHIKAICRGRTGRKEIAITFDDGPLAPATAHILDILKANEVPAAFFCIGSRMKDSPGLLRRIHEEGHLIGNHSFNHGFFFDLYGRKRLARELRETAEMTRQLTGMKPLYFRPPYGVTTPSLAAAIKAEGCHCIGWNVRSLDTVTKDGGQLLSKALKSIRPGDIVLFHDTVKITAGILQQYIDAVHEQGFRFVRLDQLLQIPAYA